MKYIIVVFLALLAFVAVKAGEVGSPYFPPGGEDGNLLVKAGGPEEDNDYRYKFLRTIEGNLGFDKNAHTTIYAKGFFAPLEHPVKVKDITDIDEYYFSKATLADTSDSAAAGMNAKHAQKATVSTNEADDTPKALKAEEGRNALSIRAKPGDVPTFLEGHWVYEKREFDFSGGEACQIAVVVDPDKWLYEWQSLDIICPDKISYNALLMIDSNGDYYSHLWGDIRKSLDYLGSNTWAALILIFGGIFGLIVVVVGIVCLLLRPDRPVIIV